MTRLRTTSEGVTFKTDNDVFTFYGAPNYRGPASYVRSAFTVEEMMSDAGYCDEEITSVELVTREPLHYSTLRKGMNR